MSAALAPWFILQARAGRNPGNPLDHLPSNIEVLTHFGERADISPDNERVASASSALHLDALGCAPPHERLR